MNLIRNMCSGITLLKLLHLSGAIELMGERESLQWRHDERDGVSNHQPHDCLLNRLFKAQIKENIKAPRYWPLWGEFTGDRWIPRTKGQWHGKCFHLMTSSWCSGIWRYPVGSRLINKTYFTFLTENENLRKHLSLVPKDLYKCMYDWHLEVLAFSGLTKTWKKILPDAQPDP